MRMITTNRVRRLAVFCLMGLWSLSADPVEARQLQAHAPDRISAGREGAIYLKWPRSGTFEGGTLSLPEGWELQEVTWSEDRPGGREVRTRSLPDGNTYELVPVGATLPEGTLILRVSASSLPGGGPWSFVPYRLDRPDPAAVILTPDLGNRVGGDIAAAEAVRGDNRALLLDAQNPPVALRARDLPAMSAMSAFTVETWFRTARTGQVLLSVWDGNEDSPYALELVTDDSGHLIFYQGMPGEHRSLRSSLPVADGTWRHVAVTHDPERSWAHLFVDGVAQDSLFHVTPLRGTPPEQLVLGGRPGSPRALLDGALDEVRIWGLARTPAMVRSTMFRELQQPAAGAVFYSFQEGTPPPYLVGDPRAVRVRPTNLNFRRWVSNLAMQMDESGVTLRWTAPPGNRGRMQVERSEDGTTYLRLGAVEAASGVSAAGGELAFQFRDPNPPEVAFYRIRQVRTSGPDQISNAVKVGRNESLETPRLAELMGSFPNPFNPSTTIRYSLKEGQEVAVSVWDLSGQRVATLQQGFQEAGDYAVFFTAEQLPSGTYFVRLETPEGVQSHPIMLMK